MNACLTNITQAESDYSLRTERVKERERKRKRENTVAISSVDHLRHVDFMNEKRSHIARIGRVKAAAKKKRSSMRQECGCRTDGMHAERIEAYVSNFRGTRHDEAVKSCAPRPFRV